MQKLYPSNERACSEMGGSSREGVTLHWEQRTQRQAAGFQPQLSFSTLPPAPSENKSSCQVHLAWGFHSFKTLSVYLSFKGTREVQGTATCIFLLVEQWVGLGDVGSAGIQLAHLLNLLHNYKDKNLFSTHQGNSLMAWRSASGEDLLALRWEASKNTLIVGSKAMP